MKNNGNILELDGVTGIHLYEDGKCIINLNSPVLFEKIQSLYSSMEQLEARINEHDTSAETFDSNANAYLKDLRNVILKDRATGVRKNIGIMFGALQSHKSNEISE